LAAQAHGLFEISRFPVDAHLLPGAGPGFFASHVRRNGSAIVPDFFMASGKNRPSWHEHFGREQLRIGIV
jgi:hypothetical protein